MPVGVEQWRAAVGAMARSSAPKPQSPIGPHWKKWLKANDPVVYKGCVVLLVVIAQLASSGLEQCNEKMKEGSESVCQSASRGKTRVLAMRARPSAVLVISLLLSILGNIFLLHYHGSCTAVIDEWPTTPVSEEGVGSLVSLLFSNIVRTGVKVVTMIVFVNQMLLMMAGDVERNPGPNNLGPNDLHCVRTAVCSIHHKWYNIGLQLGIHFTALDAMANKRTTDECLTEMLMQWLTPDSPLPSWCALVEALSSEVVGEKRLAREIQTTLEAPFRQLEYIRGDTLRVRSDDERHGQVFTDTTTRTISRPRLYTVITGGMANQSQCSSQGLHKLTSNDLALILTALMPLASNCHNLGLALDVPHPLISNIEKDYKKCEDQLREIIVTRLNQGTTLTWCDIVAALQSPLVQAIELARDIQSRYLTSSQPPPSLPPQQERAEASFLAMPVPPQPSYQPLHLLHPNAQAPCAYQQQLTHNHPHPQSHHLPYTPHHHPPLQAPHIPPQYHTQPVPSYHPQDNMPQYHGPSHHPDQYPPRLAPLNTATHSGSQVEATTEHSAAGAVRPQSPGNVATQSGSQVQGTVSPVTPDPFILFTEYVKTIYRKNAVRRDTSVVKWPPTPSTVYINLALIDRRRISGKSKKYEEVTEAMVRDGNVDVINETKGPIEFSEIGRNIYFPLSSDSLNTSPDDQRGNEKHLILVEGAPGVGKSTFAWEYCRRWERGEIAQQYQLVLLLRLRDDRISRAKTLRDLMYNPMEGVPEAVCKRFLASHGSHVMFILEGFDELPDSGRREDSVFMQLMSGKVLPLATILVTSRPWATQKIHNEHEGHIHQHIEILGFTNSRINEYIKSTIPLEKVNELSTYLDRHPQIRAGMYIPLNSAIVVTVYQESQGSGCPMPTTLTELYTALVRTLIVRYLQGHPEYGINSIQRFSDLPPAVSDKFSKLCGVAYNGIVSTNDQVQLVFSEHDLPADFDNLGLMDSVTELYVTQGTVSSHNFLHLTFQEFFAAVHISNMSPEQQLEHFQRGRKQSDDDEEQSGEEGSGHRGQSSDGRLKVILRFLAGLNCFSKCGDDEEQSGEEGSTRGRQSGDGRLKVVLRFLAGLNKLNCFSKDAINHFIQTPTRHEREKYQLSCDAEVDIDLVNWMFEAQSDDAIALLLEQKRIEISIDSYDMLPMDYYSLGYCIAHSQSQWLLRVEEDTSEEVEEEVEEERVRMLGAGASTSDGGQGGTIVGLGGTDNRVLTLTSKCLNMAFTEWKSILQLHQLSLGLHVSCDEITWPDLSQLRVLELLIWKSGVKLESLLPHLSLESLTITGGVYDGRLEYEDCVAIENHLTNTLTLKHISISGYDISASVLLVLARAIHDHPTLQEKKLEVNITIEGDDEGQDLAQLHNKYPDMVNSTGLMVTGSSDAGEVALAQDLHHNSTLRKLKLSNNSISDAGAVALAHALHHNSTLKWLLLSNNSISNVALAQALHHNSTLRGLVLSNNSMRDAGAEALAHALHHNSTLGVLDLSNNCISVDGAEALAQALHHNFTLERLYLSNNSISDAGAKALAQALHHNSTLKGLVLSNNSISDAAAVDLAQALHHNSTLEWLDLSNNSISDVRAVALAHALHHNSTLDVLDLSNNSISDVGAVELAQALHHNSTLIWLLLSNNSISDDGAVTLAQALHHNSTLRVLDLAGNDGIGKEGTCQLVEALTVNSSINMSGGGGLALPRRCEEYATQCPLYHTVKNKINFK